MEFTEQSVCTCECHIEGRNIMHMFPCCDLCYQTYLTPNKEIIPEKLEALLKSISKT